MSNNRIVSFFNNLMWCLVYTLPLLVFVGVSIHNGAFTDFTTVFSTLGIDLASGNIIYTAFDSIFGADGVLPLFTGTAPLLFVTYFASCYLLHFIVDVILWIVRWAHDLLHKGGKDLW